MSNFSDVGDFHQRFNLDNVTHKQPGPRPDNAELMEFRIKFMEEELREFKEGALELDHAKMFDALIDLVYVAMGSAQVLGYPWDEGWDEVQRANMTKVRAERAQDSLRGSTFDVVKPPGWTPPDITTILKKRGFTV